MQENKSIDQMWLPHDKLNERQNRCPMCGEVESFQGLNNTEHLCARCSFEKQNGKNAKMKITQYFSEELKLSEEDIKKIFKILEPLLKNYDLLNSFD